MLFLFHSVIPSTPACGRQAGSNHENPPGVWVTVTKPVWFDSQMVMGDDTRIEARGFKLEARISRMIRRTSIRASTTTNVGSLKSYLA